jgi:uncharacterized protein
MSASQQHRHGAPCWVDTWQPDPAAATEFYARLFGWELDRVAAGDVGTYLNATLGGRLVAGIGQAPAGAPALWSLNIRVEEIGPAIDAVGAAGGRLHVGPLAIGEQGRMAVVADSTGVPFAIWEPGSRQGAEIVGEPDAWAMSALHTTDLGAAERFYGSAFGWDLVPIPETGLSEWRLGGERVAVATATDGQTVPAHWSINFAVADADAFAERAGSLGGTVLIGPMDTPATAASPGFRNAVIADPQGGVLAVSAPRR